MDVARPDLRQRRRRSRMLIGGIAASAFLVVLIVIFLIDTTTPVVERSDILTDIVKRGEFLRAVRGPGKLVPSEVRWVVARTDATIEKIVQQPGAIVKSGDVILELSNPVVQERLVAARSEYAAAKVDLEAVRSQVRVDLLMLESALETTRGEFEIALVREEASRLGLERGVLSQVHYKQAEIEMRHLRLRLNIEEQRVAVARLNAIAQVDASQSRLDQRARTLQSRQRDADALLVLSDQDGVVQQLTVQAGQRVAAGANLVRLARPDTLMAELRIAESQAADIVVGLSVSVEMRGDKVNGSVRRVDPVVEHGTLLVEVALLDTLPPGTRSDQSVDGTIVIDRLPNALFVTRPANSSRRSSSTIFRLTGSDHAKRVAVEFGKESVGNIQLLGGLNEGDQVIVSDVSRFDQANTLILE